MRLEKIVAVVGLSIVSLSAIAEDAYLQSTGTQSINTGYFVNGKTKIEIDFQLTEITSQLRLFGQNGDGIGNYAVVYLGDTANNFKFGYGSAGFNGLYLAPNNLVRNTIVYDGPKNKGCLIQNGVTNATVSLTAAHGGTATFPMCVFCDGKNAWGNSFENYAKMKLFSLKIYEDDVLVRSYVPCLEKVSDTLSTPGLYETVQGRFLHDPTQSHAAKHDFLYGGDIMVKEDDGYIRSTGNGVINTRFFACPDMRVEMDLRITETPQTVYRILGGDYVATGDPGMAFYMSNGACLSFCHFAGGQGGATGAYKGPGYATDQLRHTMVTDFTASPVRDYFITSGTTNYYFNLGDNHLIDKTAKRPIGIFGCFKDAIPSATDHKGDSAKVYGLKFWKGQTLVHDYVPRLVDGIPGFRDMVDGAFVTCEDLDYGGAIVEEKGDAYVESTDGNRYFDTGYAVNQNTRIEADYAFLEYSNSPQQFVFEANGGMVVRVYTSGSENKPGSANSWSFQGTVGNYTSSSTPLQAGVRRHYTLDSYEDKVTLVTAGYTNYTAKMSACSTNRNFTCTKTLKLFSGSDGTSNFAKMRLYGFKIYESGVLKHDYQPIRDAGEGKLRDRVTGKILQKGKNAFTCGGKILTLGAAMDGTSRAEDAYLQSDGTQAIDLGYKTKPTTRYEIDYQLTAIKGQDRPFGAAGGGTTGGLSAELYIQGQETGSGNVAVGVGDSWTGHYSGKGSDLNRHGAVIDCSGLEWGYSGYGMAKITSACTGTGKYTMALFGKSDRSPFNPQNKAKMKLYAFRIYEAGELVHQYLPYRNGTVTGVCDTVTGAVLTDAMKGNAFVYGGEGYGKYQGKLADLAIWPDDVTVATSGTVTLTAYAPGAVKYVWTKNGEVVQGASGATLEVAWTRGVAFRTAVYGVAPVFSVDGKEVVGEVKSATLTMEKPGMAILVK